MQNLISNIIELGQYRLCRHGFGDINIDPIFFIAASLANSYSEMLKTCINFNVYFLYDDDTVVHNGAYTFARTWQNCPNVLLEYFRACVF